MQRNTMSTNELPARLRSLLNMSETRYVALLTNEEQTGVFHAREISLFEMLAILDGNGRLPDEATCSRVERQT
jgi:hypothetical protein